jgi:hypothetical protein
LSLIRGGVPAVVAMQFEIAEDVAAELTRVLYAELAAGTPIDRALSEARLDIFGRYRTRLDWAIPVLFSRAETGVLFEFAAPRENLTEAVKQVEPPLLKRSLQTWFFDLSPLGRLLYGLLMTVMTGVLITHIILPVQQGQFIPAELLPTQQKAVTATTTSTPQRWWDQSYQFRRHLAIDNWMSASDVPADYPIRLHFTDVTTPTAKDIYESSQSPRKGDDIRVVYTNQGDQIEIPHRIIDFTPSEVIIYFPLYDTTAPNNPSYTLYYGNPTANAPGDDSPNILLPRRDEHTRLLMYFEEGSSMPVRDLSGNNNHGTIEGAVEWQEGRFGRGLQFKGGVVRINSSDSLRIVGHQLTVETWFRLDAIENQTRNLVAKFTPETDSSWRLFTRYDEAIFRITYPGETGVSVSTGREELHAGRWHHLAGVYDGKQVCVYLDGEEKACVPYETPLHPGDSWVSIGDTGYRNGEHFLGTIDQVRITTQVYTSFPYGSITTDPQVDVGSEERYAE